MTAHPFRVVNGLQNATLQHGLRLKLVGIEGFVCHPPLGRMVGFKGSQIFWVRYHPKFDTTGRAVYQPTGLYEGVHIIIEMHVAKEYGVDSWTPPRSVKYAAARQVRNFVSGDEQIIDEYGRLVPRMVLHLAYTRTPSLKPSSQGTSSTTTKPVSLSGRTATRRHRTTG